MAVQALPTSFFRKKRHDFSAHQTFPKKATVIGLLFHYQ